MKAREAAGAGSALVLAMAAVLPSTILMHWLAAAKPLTLAMEKWSPN